MKRKIKKKKRRGRGNMRLDYEKCKYIRLRIRKKMYVKTIVEFKNKLKRIGFKNLKIEKKMFI